MSYTGHTDRTDVSDSRPAALPRSTPLPGAPGVHAGAGLGAPPLLAARGAVGRGAFSSQRERTNGTLLT